jgi:hypothetical protein
MSRNETEADLRAVSEIPPSDTAHWDLRHELPEYAWSFVVMTYPALVLVTIATLGGMWWYFKKTGWI